MTDIKFYHLLTTPLEKALPKLMEQALKAGMRAVVRVDSEAMMDRLNDALWTYDDHRFLPHGSLKDGFAPEQPIYITHRDENPNGAQVLVITDGALLADAAPYAKILDLFDGHNEQSVTAARSRWKSYSAAGHSVSYIKQQEGGGWKDMTAKVA